MPKISKPLIPILIILAGIVIFGGIKYFSSGLAQSGRNTEKLPERAKGNPKADIKVIEFIDFQCPACARGMVILNDYLKKHPGKLYIELRYFPLKGHRHGLTSARWTECASQQGQFWPFLEKLLDKQPEWSVLTDATPSYTQIAKEAGVDLGRLNACLADNAVDQVINVDVEEARMRKVSSTPTYFINHEMVVGTKSLEMKLNELLSVNSPEAAP